ncbi:3-hydroxyacyl-CoA dehydrogenase, partial [Pseudomonas sp. FW305-130]
AAKGRLKPEQVEAAMGALTPTLDFSALADCDLIIEAVYENMEVKKDIFSRLDAIAKPGAILASNTSSIPITRLAQAAPDAGLFVGVHFFNPVPVMG